MIGTAASRMASVSPLLPRRTTTAAIAAAAQASTPRATGLGSARPYSSYQPPNPPKQEKTSSTFAKVQRAFYRDFGAPVAKVFLGALVTYQALYWGWLKLESLETKEEKTGNAAEIASLEAQVRKAAQTKDST